jgi:hypothetical protein
MTPVIPIGLTYTPQGFNTNGFPLGTIDWTYQGDDAAGFLLQRAVTRRNTVDVIDWITTAVLGTDARRADAEIGQQGLPRTYRIVALNTADYANGTPSLPMTFRYQVRDSDREHNPPADITVDITHDYFVNLAWTLDFPCPPKDTQLFVYGWHDGYAGPARSLDGVLDAIGTTLVRAVNNPCAGTQFTALSHSTYNLRFQCVLTDLDGNSPVCGPLTNRVTFTTPDYTPG